MNDDLISRQAAIDIVDFECGEWVGLARTIRQGIEHLPSVQSKNEERMEKSAQYVPNDDLISRKAAIDALWKERQQLDDYMDECLKKGLAALRAGTKAERNRIEEDIEIIKDLPSAQPEPCVDTIDALNESIKHFDDLAEECRRNANIERNDYMDMRDDAAEYRQLSIWLNELKWLRERFQSQPEPQCIPVTKEQILQAGYEGREVRFHIGGRLFAIRELAQ